MYIKSLFLLPSVGEVVPHNPISDDDMLHLLIIVVVWGEDVVEGVVDVGEVVVDVAVEVVGDVAVLVAVVVVDITIVVAIVIVAGVVADVVAFVVAVFDNGIEVVELDSNVVFVVVIVVVEDVSGIEFVDVGIRVSE